jgi:beta-phosphoglucomutase-like phosphatase (HAD superfamily)
MTIPSDTEAVFFDLQGTLIRGNLKLAPGALVHLGELQKSGIKTALVTTASRRMVDEVIASLGIKGYFQVFATGSEVGRGKPDPEIYLLALSRCGVKADKVIAFEDSPQGVSAAVAAGISCVGVLGEYDKKILETEGATAFITSFEDVALKK